MNYLKKDAEQMGKGAGRLRNEDEDLRSEKGRKVNSGKDLIEQKRVE